MLNNGKGREEKRVIQTRPRALFFQHKILVPCMDLWMINFVTYNPCTKTCGRRHHRCHPCFLVRDNQ